MAFKNLETFYKSKEWVEFRKVLMLKRIQRDGDLICEHCKKPILKRFDTILHHVKELTPENVFDLSVSLNEDNVKFLHFKCHNEIHSRYGFECKREVYLVTGSPCSGKTSWVMENAGVNDLICDLDSIYEMISINNRYENNERLKQVVFDIRNTIYDDIKMRKGKWSNAFVISTVPFAMERKRICDMLGAKVVHIDTDKETCLSNLMKDDRRKFVRDKWCTYIEDYWLKYMPDDDV